MLLLVDLPFSPSSQVDSSFSNHALPIIEEDEQEDIHFLEHEQTLCGEHQTVTAHTTQTIVVETYDIENGLTSSESDVMSKSDFVCTESVSSNSPSPVLSEKSEILKQDLLENNCSENVLTSRINNQIPCTV